MASDWIKSRDGEFQVQAQSLIETIANHLEIWGLSRDDLGPLQQSKARFDAALEAQAEKAVAYRAVVAEKQATREELERTLRAMVRRINNHPGMTDSLRRKMELASPTRTASRLGMREETTRPATEGEDHSTAGPRQNNADAPPTAEHLSDRSKEK